jgi:murein DD-endopeptidase MepM/ murein hydrolase activator NlpD
VSAGRHRKAKSSRGLTYAAAAMFAALAAGVPATLDAQPATTVQEVQPSRQSLVQAAALRQSIAFQQEERASRIRAVQEQAVDIARAEARRVARVKAERARPKWVLPITNFRFSAGFGESGPLWSTVHTGQDFSALYGTSVRAAGDGTIIYAGYDGPYGNKIVVRHADGSETWYAHLSSYVRTKGEVQAGTVIGRVGSTGNSTGTHLHFEVHLGATPVAPLTWLREHGVNI